MFTVESGSLPDDIDQIKDDYNEDAKRDYDHSDASNNGIYKPIYFPIIFTPVRPYFLVYGY